MFNPNDFYQPYHPYKPPIAMMQFALDELCRSYQESGTILEFLSMDFRYDEYGPRIMIGVVIEWWLQVTGNEWHYCSIDTMGLKIKKLRHKIESMMTMLIYENRPVISNLTFFGSNIIVDPAIPQNTIIVTPEVMHMLEMNPDINFYMPRIPREQ